MHIHLPNRVVKNIRLYAERHHVQKVILFGSRARGTHTERSDVDIAVIGGDFDAFYREIKDDTPSLLMFDVVDLNDSVSDDLRKEIEKDGITIYEKAG